MVLPTNILILPKGDKRPFVLLTNAIGCNVKWEGKDKYWMPAEACDLFRLNERS